MGSFYMLYFVNTFLYKKALCLSLYKLGGDFNMGLNWFLVDMWPWFRGLMGLSFQLLVLVASSIKNVVFFLFY